MYKILPVLLLFLCACMANKTNFVTESTIVENAKIQPKQALQMAEEHLDKHGTVVWEKEENLKTHIVRKGKFYFVKRSDYPAKTANWYVNKCIRIDSRNGELDYID